MPKVSSNLKVRLRWRRISKLTFLVIAVWRTGKISVKTEEVIFENKEIPIVNYISTHNAKDNRQHTGNVKLRRIEIKKFSDNPTNWKAFIESFDVELIQILICQTLRKWIILLISWLEKQRPQLGVRPSKLFNSRRSFNSFMTEAVIM